MSKSGTWPGGVAMESLSNMDSAGSCDSVISMNSGYSDDSMEHLSAEERACLMYLEETIEALEVQEDSGLSNDEPDALSKAEKNGMDQIRVNDTSRSTSASGSHGIFLPLVQDTPDLAPATITIPGKTEQNTVNQTSELLSVPASMANLKAPKARDLVLQPDPAGSPSGDIMGLSTEASENDLDIIPPPSDFMDEPDTSSHPEKISESSTLTKAPPTKPPPITISNPQMISSPGVPDPRSPPAVAPKPKKLPPNIILKSHKTAPAGSSGNSGHSLSPSNDRVFLDPQRVRMEALRKLGLLKSNEEDANPCLSPKLPPKTRQSWSASTPPISPATAHTPPMTPCSPCYTPVSSPPPAIVPLQPETPTTVLPSATSTAPPIQASNVLPVPAAFRDPTGHGPLNTSSTPPLTPPAPVKKLTTPKVIGIKSATLERSGLGLSTYLTHQSSMESGQSISGDQSPRQLRNNRPRPSSLGSGKDFSHAKREDLQAGHTTSKEPDSQKSLSAQTGFQQSRESAKLPRSQGISVLICPRSENGENRREALKKLGLIRD
ncbi:specifically androgen-regulated gene protein-like isoform X2 [Melanotaenia boesemani]|uniref:specifically androgen-regulated gene protein-like isoform X2 n=1 Tax=Melanotaenia boesemani TaxID=1250792 RepID=UPI001C049911|nr:specifically androgen-regulated gene protein-like isoform X2 [Melanotaenia boesemani]